MNAQLLLVRGGAGLLGTALLAGAMWLYSAKPKIESNVTDPIRNSGTIGNVVANREFSVKVEKVEAARTIKTGLSFSPKPPVATEGVFVIVKVRAMSQMESLGLGPATLETPGGYIFKDSPRPTTSGAGTMQVDPLIWSTGAFVFELPKHRLAGARLVVPRSGLFTSLTSEAEVDLKISKTRADELLRTAAQNYDLSAVRS